jgi:hypothetical protein
MLLGLGDEVRFVLKRRKPLEHGDDAVKGSLHLRVVGMQAFVGRCIGERVQCSCRQRPTAAHGPHRTKCAARTRPGAGQREGIGGPKQGFRSERLKRLWSQGLERLWSERLNIRLVLTAPRRCRGSHRPLDGGVAARRSQRQQPSEGTKRSINRGHRQRR